MQPLNGQAYAATADSGPPIFGATGTVVGSSLEASNVDIATQFSQLIVAQQAYSANAKVMQTADQMIQSSAPSDPVSDAAGSGAIGKPRGRLEQWAFPRRYPPLWPA